MQDRQCQTCRKPFGADGACSTCSPPNAVQLAMSLHLAHRAHDMEFRKGRDPARHNGPNYLVHCAQVVHMLWEWGFDADAFGDLYSVAWLHDSVESGSLTVVEIARTVGLNDRVARCVDQLTYRDGSKDDYLATFLSPDLTDVLSLIVKVSDRLCNVRDFFVTDRGRLKGYATKYLEKGRPVLEAASARRDEIIAFAGAGARDGQSYEQKGRAVLQMMQRTIDRVRQKAVEEDAPRQRTGISP